MIFPEGIHAEEEFAAVSEALAGYGSRNLAPGGGPFLLSNMTEFGKTPMEITHARLGELGYHSIIHPVSTLRIAMKAVDAFLNAIIEVGGVANQLDNMQTREELYYLLGDTPGEIWTYPNSQTTRTDSRSGAVAP